MSKEEMRASRARNSIRSSAHAGHRWECHKGGRKDRKLRANKAESPPSPAASNPHFATLRTSPQAADLKTCPKNTSLSGVFMNE